MFALNIDQETGRILSATYPQYAPADGVIVDALPEGDVSDYLYVDGVYVYAPLPEPEIDNDVPTQLDRIEAQVAYTAMMTDTLLEV